jgi:hypothetical protein
MTSIVRIGFALSLCALAGCKETVSSEHIKTGGIAMLTEVTARSTTNVRVRTELLVGGDESNTYVELTEGDELIAVADDEEKTMERVSEGVYEATFDTAAEDTVFTVRLEREEDDDATGNTGRLPAPFVITSDLDSDPISRGDDLEITWDPSGSDDEMTLEVDDDIGDSCIFSKTFDRRDGLDDSGAYIIEGGELDGTSGDDETCEITLHMIREREGVRDRKLDPESTFFLRQVRSTIATSSP